MQAPCKIKAKTLTQAEDKMYNQTLDKIFNQPPVQAEDKSMNLGLSIIPVSSKKKPIGEWKQYQQIIPPNSYWHKHYINEGTVGIITGKVSGNLECIDVDVKNDPTKAIWKDYINLIPSELLARFITQSTPNNGFHLIYRCPEATIDGNQQLAWHTNKAVIIETRSEGGYFCTNSINNEIIRGKFDLANLEVEIPIITAKERDFLLETARSLTRYFPSGKTSSYRTNNNDKTSTDGKKFSYSEPAINAFNDSFDITKLFTKHGWSIVKEDDEKLYLLRNGSSAAHSGYYFKATKTFFCFSSSSDFKPEKPYNHFQILQVLEGKNDYKSTLKLLPSYGFSLENKREAITSDSIAEYLNSIDVKYDSFIQDLTLKGKIIEEMDYNTIFIDLKKHFEKEVARTRFEETIKSHYITTINPIQDFIDANIDRQPVGTFKKWLDCIELKNKTIDKSTVLHFLKKWYVGIIAQALDSGGEFPNEFFLCLLSTEQGLGKSTLLRNYTLPKELQVYRKEHALSFDDDFKVLMSQSLLIVDDEMDSRTYEMDKTFKNVLSTQELTMRRKYDRRISTIKRRCSFAGSGNNLFIIRELQNRRIIPIEIEKIYYDRLEQVDYTDLFMEAYQLWKEGFQYSYQRSDMELLQQLHQDYLQLSDVDLLMDKYFELPKSNEDQYHISNLEIVTTLSTKFPMFSKRINVPTIGKLMSERGFESLRFGKKRITTYIVSKRSKIKELLGADTVFDT